MGPAQRAGPGGQGFSGRPGSRNTRRGNAWSSARADSVRDMLFDDDQEGNPMPLDIGLWRLDDVL
jgi:hypothetical protein